MSPQEKSRVLGNITGAFLQAEIITAAMPTALKGIEKITQVVAESRVGQSVAQSVEKLEKFAQSAARIGTAEEVIAVTAEGIPIHIATTAEETMSFHKTAQKIGSGTKEVAKDAKNILGKETELAKHNIKQPDFIKDKRVPIDRETVLGSGQFQKTNMEIKGARVYKKDSNFYHRDTLHTGQGAHLEVYNKGGKHIGIADPLTGELIPDTAINGRTLYE